MANDADAINLMNENTQSYIWCPKHQDMTYVCGCSPSALAGDQPAGDQPEPPHPFTPCTLDENTPGHNFTCKFLCDICGLNAEAHEHV